MAFRTKNTYSTPDGGIVNTKTKTYSGPGRPPAGTRKVRPKSYDEVPTVTTDSSGKVTAENFGSKKAARGAKQKARRSQRRASRITRHGEVKEKRQRQRRRGRRIREIEENALEILRDAPASPQAAVEEAKRGVKPPQSKRWRRAFPRAARKADEEFIKSVGRSQGLKEDPLAELVISTVATAGLGGAASLAGKGIAKGAKGLAGLAARPAAETGAKLVTKAVKARPGAGRLYARGQRNLARHESRQAAKRASRRIRPKAKPRVKVRGRKYVERKRTRYGREGRKVARRTRATRVGLMTPQLTATGAGVGGLGALGAAASGHVNAFKKDPAGVTARTLEIAPGLVVSTADLAAQVVQAIGTGNTAGLQKRISEDAKFTAELVKVMASGDERRVQKYVEENGLIAPLTVAPVVGRLGRSPIKRVAGDFAGERGRRAASRRKTRKQSARDAAREEAEAIADVKQAGEPIVNAYLGQGRRRGVKGRRKLREKPVDRGDLAALVAEEGLTPTSAASVFPDVARKWDRRPRFTDKKKGGVTGHDLVELVRDDPGVWGDPAFWRTVEAYRHQEPEVRRSERVVDVQQAKTHGVQLFEDRPPPATRDLVPTAVTREDVASFIAKAGDGGRRVRGIRETIRAAEGEARELRAEARQLVKQDRRRGKPLAVSGRRRQQLLDVEADIRGMRAELAGTRRRHKAIAQALRDPAQLALAKQEFDAELAVVRQDKGLDRGVYVPHTDVGREGIPVAQPITRAGKKIYERERGDASLAERGRVNYNLAAVIEAGVQAPRIRKRVHNYVNQQVQEGAIAIPVRTSDGRVESKRLVTREEAERGLAPEQKQQVVLFPLNQFKQAVMDEDVDGMTNAIDDLAREVDWRAEDKGQKYVLLDKDLAAEVKAQVSAPGSGLRALQVGSRGLSRAILASPAWAAAQVIAESLQASVAINPLNPANVYHLAQGYRGLRQMDPEARRSFRAQAGAMPGMGATPREWFAADGRTHKGLASNFRKMERVLPLKRLLQAVRLDWLKAIDRAKGGEIRVAVAVTKAHKDAMGFGKQVERVVKGERAMSEKLAKMTPGQRLEWSVRSTPAKRKLEGYLDDMLGNWRALSRKERVASPLLIFYPFLRMSLQWPFYGLPKRHPVRAAVMYDLAASHNNQIRELLGGPPSWFSEYATAIVYGNTDDPKDTSMTRATRIVPGANAIFEAVGSGINVAAQRTLNPVVGYFNALVNGIDPLSGEKVDPDYLSSEERFIARAGLTLSLLFNTPPPLRAADQLRGAKENTSLPIVGPRRPHDRIGALMEELSGSPTERAVQTLFNPLPSKDLDHARDLAAMGRIFEIWRVAGSDAQDAVINDDTLGKHEKQKRLARMKARTDEADAELQRIAEKYESNEETRTFDRQEEKDQEAYYELKYPKEEGGTGNKYLDGASSSSGNKYLEGAKSSKGNKYLSGAAR
jgi:muconolactone delta-isomerase